MSFVIAVLFVLGISFTDIKVGKEIGDGRRESFEYVAAIDNLVLADHHGIRRTGVNGNAAMSTIYDPHKLCASDRFRILLS